MFYIGTGKDDRDTSHTKNKANRNPKKMDKVEEIEAKGFEVMVQRFSTGLNKEQGRYLEALALRSTRLGGRLVMDTPSLWTTWWPLWNQRTSRSLVSRPT